MCVKTQIQEKMKFTSSLELSKTFDIEHRIVKLYITHHQEVLETWGLMATVKFQGKVTDCADRIKNYILNEKQAAYLSCVFHDKPKVTEFKVNLVNLLFS